MDAMVQNEKKVQLQSQNLQQQQKNEHLKIQKIQQQIKTPKQDLFFIKENINPPKCIEKNNQIKATPKISNNRKINQSLGEFSNLIKKEQLLNCQDNNIKDFSVKYSEKQVFQDKDEQIKSNQQDKKSEIDEKLKNTESDKFVKNEIDNIYDTEEIVQLELPRTSVKKNNDEKNRKILQRNSFSAVKLNKYNLNQSVNHQDRENTNIDKNQIKQTFQKFKVNESEIMEGISLEIFHKNLQEQGQIFQKHMEKTERQIKEQKISNMSAILVLENENQSLKKEIKKIQNEKIEILQNKIQSIDKGQDFNYDKEKIKIKAQLKGEYEDRIKLIENINRDLQNKLEQSQTFITEELNLKIKQNQELSKKLDNKQFIIDSLDRKIQQLKLENTQILNEESKKLKQNFYDKMMNQMEELIQENLELGKLSGKKLNYDKFRDLQQQEMELRNKLENLNFKQIDFQQQKSEKNYESILRNQQNLKNFESKNRIKTAYEQEMQNIQLQHISELAFKEQEIILWKEKYLQLQNQQQQINQENRLKK
ncbi:hypothetical protein PPERSA_07914 [Pseudocohnilembus persalinus]|uniref:Uncharacterized protein n=1 Tax=Pseudocohnilembus persalinus TaxID=266149 RepID=A0A0V0QXP8_PSEPJ|nr:hypothetical protein PPERSA_07914 [Pseudocohnilembus persalinus]|eukprot:KRX06680.1 hypothetical protein PPERSA_07914 [Pseudocohnilembus persalinus]